MLFFFYSDWKKMWMIPKVIGGQKKLSIFWKHVFHNPKTIPTCLFCFFTVLLLHSVSQTGIAFSCSRIWIFLKWSVHGIGIRNSYCIQSSGMCNGLVLLNLFLLLHWSCRVWSWNHSRLHKEKLFNQQQTSTQSVVLCEVNATK